MTDGKAGDPQRLGELRAMIDAIDESVHRLLIQRATVIDELIEVKGTAKSGAAFRPGREAEMMRRLASRHSGNLPLRTVEHLWREIISTFTALQAPFSVAVAAGGDVAKAVDTARFTFGFTVPLAVVDTCAEVLDWINSGGNDKLGIVPLHQGKEAWWLRIGSARIVARLPFIEGEAQSATVPSVVLTPPLAEAAAHEVACFAVPEKAEDLMTFLPAGVDILDEAKEGDDTWSLIATRDPAGFEECCAPLHLDIRAVGGYAAPLPVDR